MWHGPLRSGSDEEAADGGDGLSDGGGGSLGSGGGGSGRRKPTLQRLRKVSSVITGLCTFFFTLFDESPYIMVREFFSLLFFFFTEFVFCSDS